MSTGYSNGNGNERSIAAIPTVYRSLRFRSKLEAKWAAFFDKLGIQWRYESEVNGMLPDFQIRTQHERWRSSELDQGILIEVRPKSLRDEQFYQKLDSFPLFSPVVMLGDGPIRQKCSCGSSLSLGECATFVKHDYDKPRTAFPWDKDSEGVEINTELVEDLISRRIDELPVYADEAQVLKRALHHYRMCGPFDHFNQFMQELEDAALIEDDEGDLWRRDIKSGCVRLCEKGHLFLWHGSFCLTGYGCGPSKHQLQENHIADIQRLWYEAQNEIQWRPDK